MIYEINYTRGYIPFPVTQLDEFVIQYVIRKPYLLQFLLENTHIAIIFDESICSSNSKVHFQVHF